MGGQTSDPYLGHVESGFSVAPSLAKWRKTFAIGQPKPAISFGLPQQILYKARLTITRVDLDLFTFKRIDTWSDHEGLDIVVFGYRNGVTIFGDVNDHSLGRRWLTFDCSYPTRQVDTLVIDILAPNSADSMGVDNIVVDPVPEPAGFAAMSLAAAALYSRRRRSNWEGLR